MLCCQIDVAKLMILLIDDENLIRRLNEEVGLNIPEKESGSARRPAVDPKGWGFACQHELVALLQLSARPGLKDGAREIGERHCRLAAGLTELVIADIRMRRILPHGASA